MTVKRVLRPPANDEWKRQVSALINKMVGGVPEDSTATDTAGIVADFNELLALLRGLNTR